MKRLIVCLALLFVLALLETDGSGQQPKKRTRPRARADQSQSTSQPGAEKAQRPQSAGQQADAPGQSPTTASQAKPPEPAQTTSQVKKPARKAEEDYQPGKGVTLSATLAATRFNNGNVSGSAWSVTLNVQNDTNKELQLGESLVVIEKARENPLYIACYVARAGASPSPHLHMLAQRYGLDWGYEISKSGGYSMFFLAGGSMSLSFSSTDPYEGLGYGRVAPHSQRKIDVQVPFPISIKNQVREYVSVIPPSIHPVGGGPESFSQTILRFDLGSGSDNSTPNPVENTTVLMRASELRATVTTSQQLWRQVFSLNWLAESNPKEATSLLIEVVTNNDAIPLLRSVAAMNLGVLKEKTAVKPLGDVVRQTTTTQVRRWAIDALGEIGEVTAAPVIRPFIDDSYEPTANAAIEALGKLKDPDAVSVLLTILNDPKKNKRHSEAATALGTIGNQAALDALIGLVRNGKSETRLLAADKLGLSGSAQAVPVLVGIAADAKAPKDLRGEAMSSLGKIGGAEALSAVPVLAGIASDAKAPKDLRGKAISSLGKIGGAEALSALRAASESDNESIRTTAISSLAQVKEAGAVEALIQLAERPGYSSRATAVRVLGEEKKTEALPALRRIAADKQAASDARREACDALAKMDDKQAIAALLAAADDSDSALYADALKALATIGDKEADQAAVTALQSKHLTVREKAAAQLRSRKWADAMTPLWQAYQAETKEDAADEMASALIELKFADKNAVPFLIGRLDPKKNPVWYQDVRLLRHLTGKAYGPEGKWSNDKTREAELIKWRQWWEGESAK